MFNEEYLQIEIRLLEEMAFRYGRLIQKRETHMNDLIIVRQLPVIEQRLRELKDEIDGSVDSALSLVCNEENLAVVKSTRAQLNKRFQELEDQRKNVKKAIMGPYDQFEAIYKECVSDAFKRADTELKCKIDDAELEIKRRCEDGLREYFAELCAVNHLNFLRYEQAEIVIDMASAKQKTPKKLREQLTSFVSGVNENVNLISSMDDAEEIMVEYKRTLDAPSSIATVQERHQRIEAEKEAQKERIQFQKQQAETIERVRSVAPPTTVESQEVEETFSRFIFSVFNVTKSQLIKIRDYLKQEGIRYE